MRIPSVCLTVGLAIACATTSLAEIPAGLRDAAARIDYGWYTGDRSLILAAREALESSPREPWSRYLRAYASYRAGQIDLARGAEAGQELTRCVADAETAAADETVAAEANVLIVSCSAMAAAAEPLRAVWHQRRLREALAQAEALAADNPRLLLVRQRHLADAAVTVEIVVSVFRDSRGRNAFPDWGEAEALLAQSEQRLAAGDRRGARDSLEEALLIAPDYTAALDLKSRIAALTAAN
jgi:hypothetical protein